MFFFFSSRRRHTRWTGDWSSDVCSSDLASLKDVGAARSIVIDERNEILAGNGVLAGAAEAGLTKLQIIEADGDTIIAVRRRGTDGRAEAGPGYLRQPLGRVGGVERRAVGSGPEERRGLERVFPRGGAPDAAGGCRRREGRPDGSRRGARRAAHGHRGGRSVRAGP